MIELQRFRWCSGRRSGGDLYRPNACCGWCFATAPLRRMTLTCAEGDRLPAGITAADCEQRLRAPVSDGQDELYPRLRGCSSRFIQVIYEHHQINVIEEPQTPSPWGI